MCPIPSVRERTLDTTIQFPEVQGPFGLAAESVPYTWKGKQYTVSEEHERASDGKFHEGGPFFTYRMKTNIGSRHVKLQQEFPKFRETYFTYEGPAVTGVPSYFGGHSIPDIDSSHLNPIGAEAISIVDPTNPNAQTGVALGEVLKDRSVPIPAIQAWKRRTEAAKAAGSEYLNAVFGWLPLVSDMKDTAQSVLDGNVIIENYHNGSGSNVHREFEFPPIIEESSGLGTGRGFYHPIFSTSGFNDPVVPLVIDTKIVKRRWFSGTFTYKANSDHSSFARCLGYGSDAEKLFGISLTPDLVWELTPWSWAIDWFSNAQNVIHNVGAFELAGLIMRYGYIMEETSRTDTYQLQGTGLTGVSGVIPPSTVTTVVKRRAEANPFGFGIGWEDLSPTQLAITAALGITRLR